MATISQTAQPQSPAAAGYPEGGLRFDWAAITLACIFMAGLWVDGWAHFHNRTDNTFFTPWHFLFYSAFGMTAAFVAYHQWRNQAKGYAFRRSLPQGYWLTLVGVVIFAFGGVGDMIWHILFGIEGGTEALTSPTHIMLATGMALVFSGPLRAAWNRSTDHTQGGWRALGPAILSATILLALLAFFTSYAHPVINPLAISSGNSSASQNTLDQIYVMNADGRLQTRLTSDSHLSSMDAAWSPDGRQIVYVYGNLSENQSESDLYIMNADGTHAVQLTHATGQESSPVWSPDGKQIAYLGTVDGSHSIFVISPDGGEPTRITNDDANYLLPVWSPDSRQIAVTVLNANQGDIVVMNADGSGVKMLTQDGNSFEPVWSPDGSQISLTRRSGNNFDIFLMNADGSDNRQLTTDPEFDYPQAFSPDGKQIYFGSERLGPTQIFVMPITGEGESGVNARNLSNNLGLQIGHVAVSPDGSKILFSGSVPSSRSANANPQDFGVASVLLQAGLLGSFIVLLTWKWRLPFGAFTLMLTLSTFMLTIMNDFFLLVPGALIAGLVADVLVWRLKPAAHREMAFHLFAFLVPVVFYALYFLTLQLAAGISWHIHVWAGAIFLSGVIAWLLSYLVSAPARSAEVLGRAKSAE